MESSLGYSVGVVRTTAGFLALRGEWARLYREARPRNPFLSFEWTDACRTHHSPGAGLYILTAHSDSGLAGIAPLRIERPLGFRVLRFVGDGRSDYLGFLLHPEHPHAGAALLSALAARTREWDLAVLRQLSETYGPIREALLPKGLIGRGVQGTVAPHLAFEGEWDELCASGPAQLRQSRRQARKFEKAGGQVERRSGREAAGCVEEIAALERSSWKGREGAARFQPGRGMELLRQALESMDAEMEVWIARLEGRAVACQINFLAPGRLLYYQGCYDAEYRKLSPGAVLHCHVMEYAWRTGVREYDFMSGDESYKAGWTNRLRVLRYLAVFPRCLRGAAAYGTLVAPRWKLKGSSAAHAVLRYWIQLKANPPLHRGSGARSRPEESHASA